MLQNPLVIFLKAYLFYENFRYCSDYIFVSIGILTFSELRKNLYNYKFTYRINHSTNCIVGTCLSHLLYMYGNYVITYPYMMYMFIPYFTNCHQILHVNKINSNKRIISRHTLKFFLKSMQFDGVYKISKFVFYKILIAVVK